MRLLNLFTSDFLFHLKCAVYSALYSEEIERLGLAVDEFLDRDDFNVKRQQLQTETGRNYKYVEHHVIRMETRLDFMLEE